jgi:glycosyltransferase involved in cell wall biosynthesis
MKNKQILINGNFLCRNLTGIERYAFEITKRLDKISSQNEISIILPSFLDNIPQYKNLNVIRLVKKNEPNIRWQLFTLQGFLLRHKKYTILEFGNVCLPFSPGIVFLHDIYCELFPNDFTGFRDILARFYTRIQYRIIARLAKQIITVSEYSKKLICKTFKVDPAKIKVIYSSADHICSINSDFTIFDKFPVLSKNPFYFSLGSLSKRKNLKWILDYANNHPESFFAISGSSLSIVKIDELNMPIPGNIVLLGYLEDEKVKALMEKCKAFILPSYYEGFGLTPLEALSCGAQIIVSNTSSLPEIYGNTAHYIDPFNTNVDLDELLNEPVEKPDMILSKYSYDIAAWQVYEIIKEFTA